MPRSARQQKEKPSVLAVQSSVMSKPKTQNTEVPAALLVEEVTKDIREQVICNAKRLEELRRLATNERALIIRTKHITGGYMVPNNQTGVIRPARNMKVLLARAANRNEAEIVVKHLDAVFSSPVWAAFFEWRIHEHIDPRLDKPIIEIALYVCEQSNFHAGIIRDILRERGQTAEELKVPMLMINPAAIYLTVNEADDYTSRSPFYRWDFSYWYKKEEKASC
jgi:hypothetical protein